MLSQQQNNIHWPEEGVSPSLEPTEPASSWQSRSLWLRLLGVGIAFVAGFALKFLPMPGEAGWNLFLLLVVLTGVVSAALLRSWWALLIVPVAFNLGQALGTGVGDGFEWFVPTLVSLIEVFFMVLVEIGVFIGTPLGAMIERRLRHSGKAFEEMDRNRIAR